MYNWNQYFNLNHGNHVISNAIVVYNSITIKFLVVGLSLLLLCILTIDFRIL